MYDLFLSRLAAVNNNLEKYMPSGIEVDGSRLTNSPWSIDLNTQPYSAVFSQAGH
ncbi:hypothetical protein [Burkholderia pseudomallei]|uniref:hypothetical protein n=1 Tax=Burkholderia pseudomallei TaxID=28450 RepID=UPI000A8951DE|nr:hypothetical protein [Burkholderia pseudomallei]